MTPSRLWGPNHFTGVKHSLGIQSTKSMRVEDRASNGASDLRGNVEGFVAHRETPGLSPKMRGLS